MGCLYKLVSPSGKAYIGISSKTLAARWAKHIEHALGKRENGYLYSALRKYGTEAFTREVISEHDDWNELCRMEIAAIKVYGSFWPHGYNLTSGGEGVAGRVTTDRGRANISAAQRKRFENPYERARLLAYGKKGNLITSAKRAIEQQAKREKQAAYIASPEFKEMRSQAIKAAMRRPEVAAKLKRVAQERALSTEWRRKISQAKKGVSTGPCTEHRRRLVSEARKREWTDPDIREKRLAGLVKARAAKAAA